MGNLLKSRKFWMLVLDVVVSLATYFISKYTTPEIADDVLVFIATMQPVFVMIIASIAYEDGQAMAAGSHPSQIPSEE